jgi:homoaconitase/3-isopropylmalate dehydratase large subunit
MGADIYLGGPLTVAAAAVAGEIIDPRKVFDGL